MLARNLLLFLWTTATLVAAQTTSIQQLGQSGKFRISDGSDAEDPNRITVEVDFVQEEPSSETDHGTNTVANQDFTITLEGTTTIQGIDASLTQFESDLVTTGSNSNQQYGTIRMDFYRFNEAGTISTGTESFDVNVNDVKINLYLDNWSFDTNSEFVDVGVIIQGTKDAATEEEENKWDLGSNVPLLLSGRVTIDGVERNMQSGYPTYTKTGNKGRFVFRFDKFSSYAEYDPIIGYSSVWYLGSTLQSCFAFVTNTLDSMSNFLGF